MNARSYRTGRRRYYLVFAAVIGLAAAALIVATRNRPAAARRIPVSDARAMMGTEVSLTVLAGDRQTGIRNLAAAFDRLSALERVLSATLPDSELTRLNERAAREPAAVSDDLFRAVRMGVEWFKRTRGAFDITVSPLLNLWRTCGRENRLPSEEEMATVRTLLGADRLGLDLAKQTIRFPVEGMRLHLGGLGKGFSADEATALLRERGVRDAIIRVAGDIYALGHREDGRPWRVGIQDPREPDSPGALLSILELSDMAVSTSGNYQRFVEIQGRRYSHIVDPRAGLTANDVPSVTVIGPNTLTTDILGTALSVLGVEEGAALVESMPGVEAMFVTFDAKEEPGVTRTTGFSRYEAAPEQR